MTLREVARAAGIHIRGVQRIEAGETIPGADVAIRLARAMGTTVEVLFGEQADRLDSGGIGEK